MPIPDSEQVEARHNGLMRALGWMFGLTWLLIIAATCLVLWRLS